MRFSDECIIIEPKKSILQMVCDIWPYRELFFFLSWRNLLVRYKQTMIGVMWSILRPLLTMIIFTIVFSYIAGLSSSYIPYPIMVYSGMILWQFFSNLLSDASDSVLADANLVTKVFFPRIIIPTSRVIPAFVDALISLALFILLMIFFGMPLTWQLLWFPVLFINIGLLALGLGYFFSALSIKYRDCRFVVPFIIQISLYISPVGYSGQLIPEHWRWVFIFNPLFGLIEGFRWCLSGGIYVVDFIAVGSSILISCAVFVGGFLFFIVNENKFADTI